jgi:hypothetical protein
VGLMKNGRLSIRQDTRASTRVDVT